MIFKKVLLTAGLILFLTNLLPAQKSVSLDTEDVLFSFDTEQGKTVSFCKSQNKQGLVFKYGTDKKTDILYPQQVKPNELLFTYSYYLRGGASANEGIDLNYIYFELNGFKYILYETSHYGDKKNNVGLKVINIKTADVSDYKAVDGTVRGTLLFLRDSELVIKGEELFD